MKEWVKPHSVFDGNYLRMLRESKAVPSSHFGHGIGYWERGDLVPNIYSLRTIIKKLALGPFEIIRLLRLRPPGVTHHEFYNFLHACDRDQTTPAIVLAQFIKAYPEIGKDADAVEGSA